MASVYFPVMFSNSFHQPRRTRLCCPQQNRNSLLDLLKLLEEQPLIQRSHPLMGDCSPGCSVFETNARLEPEFTKKQPWIHRLKIKGYDPSDITVKVDDNRIIVHAVHEEKHGDNLDKYETKRTVNIPGIVNKEKISSFLLDGGHLVITAPYDVDESEKVVKETSDKELDIDMQRDNETLVNQSVLNEKYVKLDEEDKMTNSSAGNEVVGNDRSEEQDDTGIFSSKNALVDETNVEHKGEKTSSNGESETAEEITVIDGTTTENDSVEHFNRDDDLKLEETYVITSPPPSPVQASIVTSALINKLPVVENIEDENETEKKEDTRLHVTTENDLPPLMDSKEIIDINGEKVFQLSMNLQDFSPENVSIKFRDNVVSIDAEKELNNEGICTTQKIHRKFLVPDNGIVDKVLAKMSDGGLVKITVPLQETKEGQTIEVKKE